MLKLVQLNGAQAGRVFNLNAYQTVGRGASNHLVIEDPYVSREQCVLHVQSGIVTLVAKDQTAPMLLNGQRVDNCSVRLGDVLQFGQTQFGLQTDEPVRATTGPTVPAQPSAPTIYAQQPMHGAVQQAPQGPVAIGGTYQNAGHPAPGVPFHNTGNVNQIQIVQRQDNSCLWAVLAVVCAVPLFCVSILALALLPFTMCFVGAVLLTWGLVEYYRWRGYYQIPTITWVKIVGGSSLIVLGLICIIIGAFAMGSDERRGSSNASLDNPSIVAVARKIHKHDPKGLVDSIVPVPGERVNLKGNGVGVDEPTGRPTVTYTCEVVPHDFLLVFFYADDMTVCMESPDPNNTEAAS